MNLERLKKLLIYFEGKRNIPYKCSKGKLTCGIGWNIDANGYPAYVKDNNNWTDAEINMAFLSSIHTSMTDAREYIGGACFSMIGSIRQEVLIMMVFQLGLTSLQGFVKFKKAMLENRFDDASAEMLDSQWHKDTPERCKEMAYAIKHNEYSEELLSKI